MTTFMNTKVFVLEPIQDVMSMNISLTLYFVALLFEEMTVETKVTLPVVQQAREEVKDMVIFSTNLSLSLCGGGNVSMSFSRLLI